MNFKTIWVGILGLFGMGPLAVSPDPQPKIKTLRKPNQADLERIEEARQKRLRKQAKRLSPDLG